MIHVQMRADHEVHRLRRHPRRAEIAQELGAHHVEGRPPAPVLVVAHAGVDQRGHARRPHDEGVDALQEPALLVQEMRRQPLAVALDGFGRGVGEQPRGARGARALHDGGDAEAAEGEIAHGGDDYRPAGARRKPRP
jgi:hypothetical protein